MRELTEADVEFTLECLPEDQTIKGNCSAIDDETDAATEDWIESQLESGNEWAWCCAKVTAKWNGFEGTDYLGGCSYKSEADFRSPGGYFDDMKTQSLEDLNKQVSEAAQAIATLSE